MSEELTSPSAPIEPTETEAQSPSPKDDPASAARFAALAKQRKAFYREQQSYKQEREQFDRERREYDEWKQSKSKARENPNDYLSKGGLSYEDLVNYQLNGGKPTPELEIKSVKEEIEALKREYQESLKAREEEKKRREQEETQSQIENWKRGIREQIAGKKDDFELINELDYHDMVPSIIEKKFQEAINEWRELGEEGPQPVPISHEEAAKELEAQLRETVERLVTKTKAFSGKYSKVEQALAAAASGGSAPSPSKTLSNSTATASAPSYLPAKTEADRIARALAALERKS